VSPRAFSSEVDPGSRKENASRQRARAPFRSNRNGKGSNRSPRVSGHALLLIAAAPVLLFLLLPSLIIVPMALSKSQMIQFPPEWISIHAFTDYFQDEQWIASTVTSAPASKRSCKASMLTAWVCVRNGSNGIDFFMCGPRSFRMRM